MRETIEKECEICGTKFEIFLSDHNRGRGRFCSKECVIKHRKTFTREKSSQWKGGVSRKCDYCGKEYRRPPANIGRYCCKRCSELATIGSKHKQKTIQKMKQYSGPQKGNWNGGKKKNTQGYVEVIQHDHPRATPKGYVKEHIIVVEEFIGRPLNRKEVVHHINEIRDDNRPENLYIFENVGQHSSYHNRLRAGSCEKILHSNLKSHLQEK